MPCSWDAINPAWRLCAILFVAHAPDAAAAWHTSLLENTRTSLDVSSRAFHAAGHEWSQHAIGADLHKVFSGTRGDIGTLIVQPYFLRIDDPPAVPPLFSDGHDWALQWRIANFNYSAVGHGRFNIRIGHFEVPFGLEQVVQTNGTLHQVQSPTPLKADWGTSVNGTLTTFEYELAYMLGSGNEWDTDETGVVVGRIGLPRDNTWWVGASLLNGKYQASVEPRSHDRLGIDYGVRLPRGIALMSEYARGHDDDKDVRHLYVELSWQSANETIHGFSNWRKDQVLTEGEWRQEEAVGFGIRYEPNLHWSLSFMVSRSFKTDFSPTRDRVTAQIRYRT